jgi:DNA polymerase
VYGIDKKIKFIWGGTMCENLTQALARDIVFEQMLAIDEKYRVVSSTHDELLILVKEEEAKEALAWCIGVMSTSPKWAPDLPLGAEGGVAKYYCK